MFEKLVNRVRSFTVAVATWQINERYERAALRLLDQVHTGASVEWVGELFEQRGRHALATVAHH